MDKLSSSARLLTASGVVLAAAIGVLFLASGPGPSGTGWWYSVNGVQQPTTLPFGPVNGCTKLDDAGSLTCHEVTGWMPPVSVDATATLFTFPPLAVGEILNLSTLVSVQLQGANYASGNGNARLVWFGVASPLTDGGILFTDPFDGGPVVIDSAYGAALPGNALAYPVQCIGDGGLYNAVCIQVYCPLGCSGSTNTDYDLRPRAPFSSAITSITPSIGATGGGTAVTIALNGEATGKTSCTLDGTACTGLGVVNDYSITCTSAASSADAGTGNVACTGGPTTTSPLINGWTYANIANITMTLTSPLFAPSRPTGSTPTVPVKCVGSDCVNVTSCTMCGTTASVVAGSPLLVTPPANAPTMGITCGVACQVGTSIPVSATWNSSANVLSVFDGPTEQDGGAFGFNKCWYAAQNLASGGVEPDGGVDLQDFISGIHAYHRAGFGPVGYNGNWTNGQPAMLSANTTAGFGAAAADVPLGFALLSVQQVTSSPLLTGLAIVGEWTNYSPGTTTGTQADGGPEAVTANGVGSIIYADAGLNIGLPFSQESIYASGSGLSSINVDNSGFPATGTSVSALSGGVLMFGNGNTGTNSMMGDMGIACLFIGTPTAIQLNEWNATVCNTYLTRCHSN